MSGVPMSLFLTRRALCPGCGAPLQLQPDSSSVACQWCRETSYVERRLRTVELEIAAGLEPGGIEHGTKFIPAHSIAATGKAEAACPGCGGAIEISNSQDTAKCPHCGSAAKVERRLVATEQQAWESNDDDHDLEMFKAGEPRDFDREMYWEYAKLDESAKLALLDEWNDQRVRILLTSEGAEARVAAIAEMSAWHEINPWRERMLARLMRLAGNCEPEVEVAIALRAIQPNLYRSESGENEVRNAVFRAAGRALFVDSPSARVLKELALSFNGATLKLMMELMDYAFTNGRFESGFAALRAATTALDRAYEDRAVFGEVMLYRFLYLKPPMLAWVLDQRHHWSVEDRYKCLRFIDDCAIERPELVPQIRELLGAQQGFKTPAAYRNYLDFVRGLATPLGRESALRLGVYAPETDVACEPPDDLQAALEFLHPLLAEPNSERTATACINRLIQYHGRGNCAAIEEYIASHGDALPWRIRQAYLHVCPDSKLLTPFEFQNTFESKEEPPNALQREVAGWQQRFTDAWRDKDESSELALQNYRDLRKRVVSLRDQELAARKQEWQRQETLNNQHQRDLHEAEAAAARQQTHDNWLADSIRMLEEQAAQQREYHAQYGNQHYLKSAESLDRQAEKLRRGELPKRPWYVRLLPWRR
ncbi:MAG: hypothetical protein KDB90_14235 [Planctomycetes bacterium]|nr:hypothetical protein [Planctomycetota bacterium]